MLKPWTLLSAAYGVEFARCYRCLVQHPRATLTRLVMPCGCEEGFCPDCCTPDLGSWMSFVAGRCIKGADRVLELAA